MNNKKIVLDTCYFFCLTQKEEGWELTKDILEKAQNLQLELFISRVNYCEILYQIKRIKEYNEIKEMLENLPIKIVDTNKEICEFASNIKSKARISLGDSFAIGTAIYLKASVATTDRHEFTKFENDVDIIWLR